MRGLFFALFFPKPRYLRILRGFFRLAGAYLLYMSEGAVETYLTIEELAKHLKVAEQTIRRWILNREVPYRKIRKAVRFRLSEIERWIEGGGLAPAEAGIEEGEDALCGEGDAGGGEV